MIFPYKASLRCWYNTTHFPAQTHRCVDGGTVWSNRQTAIAWVVLVAASLCVLVPNLSYPLIEPDETRYAQIAIEMNRSRDWVTPMLDGVPYLDKPPLVYWLTATSFGWFGNNEIAARLPSTLSALLTIVILFSLGSRIVGRRAAWVGSL
jgi:4-amino-4-deoxy-L-arabinose transferase-like glycosyltransferase